MSEEPLRYSGELHNFAMPSWTPSAGEPRSKEDDDVLQHISYFEKLAAQYDRQGKPQAAAECREAVEEYRKEARRRGLLPVDE